MGEPPSFSSSYLAFTRPWGIPSVAKRGEAASMPAKGNPVASEMGRSPPLGSGLRRTDGLGDSSPEAWNDVLRRLGMTCWDGWARHVGRLGC